MRIRAFFSELKRRRVFRTAIVYAVVGWATLTAAPAAPAAKSIAVLPFSDLRAERDQEYFSECAMEGDMMRALEFWKTGLAPRGR